MSTDISDVRYRFFGLIGLIGLFWLRLEPLTRHDSTHGGAGRLQPELFSLAYVFNMVAGAEAARQLSCLPATP
jgi:hypothetical protein